MEVLNKLYRSKELTSILDGVGGVGWIKLKYIHMNPVHAGIVDMAEHYVYSSASNYARGKGLLEVELADGYIDAVG